MAFKFENLLAWQKAMDLNDKIHNLSKDYFPKDELYILSSQIRRAADSIILNTAEGCTGQSKASFKVFLNYSYAQLLRLCLAFLLLKGENILMKRLFKICMRNLKLFAKLSQA